MNDSLITDALLLAGLLLLVGYCAGRFHAEVLQLRQMKRNLAQYMRQN